jgi:hypothetical protein
MEVIFVVAKNPQPQQRTSIIRKPSNHGPMTLQSHGTTNISYRFLT